MASTSLRTAILSGDDISIYRDVSRIDHDELDQKVRPILAQVLFETEYRRRSGTGGHFFLKGIEILQAGPGRECFLDLSMPERIVDYYIFRERDSIKVESAYEWRGSRVIPAVAIEGFGKYNLYYAKSKPEIGLEVLKNGLRYARRRHFIALDMACILRDEQRFEEAINYFTMAIDEAAQKLTYFTFFERARLYEKIGDHASATRDLALVRERWGQAVLDSY